MIRKRFLSVVFVLIASVAPVSAFAGADAVETGRLLAILLDAGRGVLAANQPLINDASKGDKGFTPSVFVQQLAEKFKARTNVDLDNLKGSNIPDLAKKLLPELIDAAKQTVANNQDKINKQGVAYKGFTPAHFGTQTATLFSDKSGIYMKQTTTNELLRNPKNKADEFESGMMKKFGDPAYPRQGDKIASETVGGSIRVMLPLYYGKGCLGCHGGPKGEMDVSGYKKEGAKEGDLGGAISVKLSPK
jgi:general secretion pathway protein A